MAGTKVKHRSGVADGATAIGYELDTQASLVTAGAKILSVKNAGVEKFAVDKDGNTSSQTVRVVRPDEGSAGINSAITALNAIGGGVVQLLPGTYVVSGVAIGTYYIAVFDNITIQGMGDSTILDIQSGAGFTGGSAISFNANNVAISQAINNFTKGDTSVFTTTPANAGAYQTGDFIKLSGLDIDGQYDQEWHEVASNGIPGTGEVPLKTAVLRTMTSITSNASRNNKNNAMKNFKIIHTSGIGQSIIQFSNPFKGLIENVTFEDSIASDGSISMGGGILSAVRGCKLRNIHTAGIDFAANLQSIVENNIVDKTNTSASVGAGGMNINNNVDCTFRNNEVYNSTGPGMTNIYGSGAVSRRLIFDGNKISVSTSYGIAIGASSAYNADNSFINNKVDNIPGPGLELQSQKRASIVGNHVFNCTTGMRSQGGQGYTLIGNLFEKINGGEAISLQVSIPECAIIGNIVRQVTGVGIYMSVIKSTCSGNIVDTTSSHGIQVLDDDNIVQGNIVKNASGDGIHLTATANDNIVMGNNAGGEGINDLGTNNDLAGNKV